MTRTERTAELASVAERLGIERFSAAEMVELLEDGEEVAWIVDQVLPEGPDTAATELRSVLERIGTEVAPAPAPADETETAAEEAPEEINWDDLGDLNLPPGVDPQQLKELMNSPRGALMADFGAFCEEKGFDPQENSVGADEVNGPLREMEEEWLKTPREAFEGKTPTEVLGGGRLFPTKVETYRREEPKVGRNDPCPCGSGKKYKKCCGKAA